MAFKRTLALVALMAFTGGCSNPDQTNPVVTAARTTVVNTQTTATATVPGPTETVSVNHTIISPGPTRTVVQPSTQVVQVPGPTATKVVVEKVPVPGPTHTVKVPGPTRTVDVPVPGPTKTVAVPVPAETDVAGPGDTAGMLKGTVKSVDPDGTHAQITHEAIPALHLAAGTDTFRLVDNTPDLVPGEAVTFAVQPGQNQPTITRITKATP